MESKEKESQPDWKFPRRDAVQVVLDFGQHSDTPPEWPVRLLKVALPGHPRLAYEYQQYTISEMQSPKWRQKLEAMKTTACPWPELESPLKRDKEAAAPKHPRPQDVAGEYLQVASFPHDDPPGNATRAILSLVYDRGGVVDFDAAELQELCFAVRDIIRQSCPDPRGVPGTSQELARYVREAQSEVTQIEVVLATNTIYRDRIFKGMALAITSARQKLDKAAFCLARPEGDCGS